MNILYIHTSDVRDKEILDALKKTVTAVFEEDAPKADESNESYATRLIQDIEEHGVDVCFSLDYFPIVSIGCEAMKKIYIAYTQKPYTPSLYSLTLKNSCNLIFVPDYSVYERFNKEGCANVRFMPIGVGAENVVAKVSEADSESGPDLTITQEVKPREMVELNLLSSECPLKDATKGYLEGCVACRHQIRGLPSMYHYLPSYIREEILSLTPQVLEPMSVESPETYFDNRSFNELVTTADRDIHFSAFLKIDYFKNIAIYSDTFVPKNEKVSCFKALKRGPEFAEATRKSKLNIIIPHRNWVSGVSGRTWDAFAAGGYVIEPFMADLLGLFETPMEYLYTDELSMVSNGINRLNHADERVSTINAILDELREKHTYESRFEGIFSYIG